MLFAELSSGELWTGVAAVLTALAGATAVVLGAVSKARRESHEQAASETKEASAEGRQARTDAIAEWKDYVGRLEADIETCKEENKGFRKQLHSLRDDANSKILALTVAQALCEKENAELRGEIRLLQATMQRVQTHVGLGPSPLPAVIVADTDGVIAEASPSIGAILEWLPKDLVGQSLDLLVPPEYLERHREGLRKIRATGSPPWTERTILTEAFTKSGKRVKVAVHVKGWKDPSGKWFLSGEIQNRPTEGGGQ